MKTVVVEYEGEQCLFVDRDGEWLIVRPNGDIVLLDLPDRPELVSLTEPAPQSLH